MRLNSQWSDSKRITSWLAVAVSILVGNISSWVAAMQGNQLSSQRNCSMQWPRSAVQDTCPLTFCKHTTAGGTTRYTVIDDSLNETCKSMHPNATETPLTDKLRNIIEVSSPHCRTPSKPKAWPTVYPAPVTAGYLIRLEWQDPDDAESHNLIGYQVILYEGYRGSGNPVETFEFSKNFTANGDTGGNRVDFGTTITGCVRRGNCQPLSSCAIHRMFQDTQANLQRNATFHFKVTSLPVRDRSDLAVNSQSTEVQFEVPACDHDAVKCLLETPDSLANFARQSCASKQMKQTENCDSGFVCHCVLYNVFYLSSINTRNGTNQSVVTVFYRWGDKAKPNDTIEIFVEVPTSQRWHEHKSIVIPEYANKTTANKTSAGLAKYGQLEVVVIGPFKPVGPNTEVYVKAGPRVRDNIVRIMKYPIPPPAAKTPPPTTLPSPSSTAQPTTTPLLPSTPQPGASSSSRIITIVSILACAALVILVACIAVLTRWQGGAAWGKIYCAGLFRIKTKPPRPSLLTTPQLPAPTVYISYSRFSLTSQKNAMHLADLLQRQFGVVVIIDVYHQNQLAADELMWIQQQIRESTKVVVLLDNAYPWSTDLLDFDRDGDLKRARLESKLLQSEEYRNRPSFLVPVFIGPSTQHEQFMPPVLRCRTIHQLPVDFDGTGDKFARLVEHLFSASTNTSLEVYMSAL